MDGAVLGLVINRLDTIIQKEVKLIGGANDELKTLRNKLNLLKPYIERLNEKMDHTDKSLRELVKQLHEVSCEAEDAVDLYETYVDLYKMKSWAKKLLCLGVPILHRRRQLSTRANQIIQDINVIMDDKDKYEVRLQSDTPTSTFANQQNGNVSQSLNVRMIPTEDVLGFKKESSEIIDLLIPKQYEDDEDKAEERRRTISIIGMPGIGKSTLAKKFYDDKHVNDHFTTKVWVVVSQNISINHLLTKLLKALNKHISLPDEDDIQDLKSKLGEELNDKRYLIVLDDIWEPELWNDFESCLPADQKNASRIMLTSRFTHVANAASTDSNDIKEVQALGPEDSWLLFCKKALKGKACPDNLVKIGKKIVSKCKGLPLSIVLVGGSLSAAETTPTFATWSTLLRDRSWHDKASEVISLSYRCLPADMKTCFLYIGVFPEDYEIQAKDLYLLWVAEGFIPSQRSGMFEEDVAEKYLIALVDRHLITVSKVGAGGGIKTCRIHDMLRAFCITEAGKCNLYEMDTSGTFEDVKQGARRLTVSSYKPELITSLAPLQKLRTLLLFGKSYESPPDLIQECNENLAVARVLHLEPVAMVSALEYRIGINKLIMLRYLRVSFEKARKRGRLPSISVDLSSLSKMLNLQVLSLSGDFDNVFHFPSGIWNLKCLKHIKVSLGATLPDARSSYDKMLALETLSTIHLEKHTLKLISNGKFPKLRKIKLYMDGEDETLLTQSVNGSILQILPSLLLLKSVNIRVWSFPPTPLVGAFSHELTKINLGPVALTSDHWMQLGKLECLQVLKLYIRRPTDKNSLAYEFHKKPLEIKATDFPQLITFILLSDHSCFELADGALKTLQYLFMSARKEDEVESYDLSFSLCWSVDFDRVRRFNSGDWPVPFADATVEESILHFNKVLKGTILSPENDEEEVSCSKNKGYYSISEPED